MTEGSSPRPGTGSPAAALMAVLDLEPRGDDLYVGTTPTTRVQRIFVRQVASQALCAANATVGADRIVH